MPRFELFSLSNARRFNFYAHSYSVQPGEAEVSKSRTPQRMRFDAAFRWRGVVLERWYQTALGHNRGQTVNKRA
jgi:hypothetical protein